ncbi:MAG: AI-2E family transporter [Candidatus Paceibacterota bacterium]
MIPEPQPIPITITAGTVIKILAILTIGFLLYLLLDVVLILLTSIVIASAVEPATAWFSRYRIPRVPAVLFVYIFSFLLILGFFYIFIPPLVGEISLLASDLPERIESIDLFSGIFEPISAIGGLPSSFVLEDMLITIRGQLAGLSGGAFTTAATLFGGAFSFIMILVLSFYLAVQEKGIDNFLRLVTPIQHEKYISSVWHRSQSKIGQWMKGQLLLGLMVGILVFLTLTILGVKYAFTLAVLAAIMELIPVFGPIIAAVPAIIVGLIDGPTMALLILAAYIIIQQFESNLLYPLVVKKVVGLSPIIVIVVLVVGAKLFGFLGIILAVPLATVMMELLTDAEKKKVRQLQSEGQSENNLPV